MQQGINSTLAVQISVSWRVTAVGTKTSALTSPPDLCRSSGQRWRNSIHSIMQTVNQSGYWFTADDFRNCFRCLLDGATTKLGGLLRCLSSVSKCGVGNCVLRDRLIALRRPFGDRPVRVFISHTDGQILQNSGHGLR